MNIVENEIMKMQRIIEERITENKKLFTEEEINTIFLNNNLAIKLYLLGILDIKF